MKKTLLFAGVVLGANVTFLAPASALCAHYHGYAYYPNPPGPHGDNVHVHSGDCHAIVTAPPPGGPAGRKCGFTSTTDVTREAGWQIGEIDAGPLVTGEAGTLYCTIIVNSDSHSSTNVRAQTSFDAVDGVIGIHGGAPQPVNYQATAADDVALCTKWVGTSGTQYWVGGNTATGDLGHWSTNAADSCGVALSFEPNDPECSIWHAIDRRLGTNVAEIWQDCEPYGEFPLPI